MLHPLALVEPVLVLLFLMGKFMSSGVGTLDLSVVTCLVLFLFYIYYEKLSSCETTTVNN